MNTLNLPDQKRKPKKTAYRKPESVKLLEAMADQAAIKKYPGTPVQYLAPRKHRDDSANSLTKCIVDFIGFSGGFASRINSTGIYDKRLGKYRPGTSRKGLADIMATFKGLSLHIEVKFGNDRQSEAQMKIQREVESSGGYYFIAKDFSSFKIWFDNI